MRHNDLILIAKWCKIKGITYGTFQLLELEKHVKVCSDPNGSRYIRNDDYADNYIKRVAVW